MSVSDGQKATAANFNAAFVSKNINSTVTSKIDLFNTSDLASGPRVQNVQQAITELWDTVGISGLGDAGRKNYSSNFYVVNGDDHKVAIGKLDQAVKGLSDSVNEKLNKPGTSTTHALARFTNASGEAIESTGVTVDNAGNMEIPGDLLIDGDLTVTGTTTTVNSASLEVSDQTIKVNVGGNDATAENSGLLVERTSTFGSFLFDSSLASFWKIGLLGAEKEVADVSSAQTFINKIIDAALNTITNLTDAAIDAAAAIARTKLASGNPDHVLINDPSGVMSSEQFLDKARGGTGQDNSSLLFPASGTVLVAEGPSGSFQFANNTVDQNVTGLLFNKAVYRSAKVEWSVYRKSTGGGGQIRVQCGSFYIIHDDSDWTLTDGPMSGAPAGVFFDVVGATGQIQIDADDNGGTFSAPDSVLKFKTVNVTEV